MGKLELVETVLIVDHENTGQIQHGSRWQGFIHEFVELKHGLEPGSESLTSASLSHPVFFNFYSRVLGLTGTVGDDRERD